MPSLCDAYDAAISLGCSAHAGQTWHDGVSYDVHLQAVECNIVKFLTANEPSSIVSTLQTAAWLHDAVEDTGMSLDLIEQQCGKEVRSLVWAVTDEPGANRRERHEKTYPKIRSVPYAVALKLADRIANVEISASKRDGLFKMYRKEHSGFKQALYTPGQFEAMWTYLDTLLDTSSK